MRYSSDIYQDRIDDEIAADREGIEAEVQRETNLGFIRTTTCVICGLPVNVKEGEPDKGRYCPECELRLGEEAEAEGLRHLTKP